MKIYNEYALPEIHSADVFRTIWFFILFTSAYPGHAQYDYSDNMPPSVNPPGGLKASQVPMFVSIGWDDNCISGTDGTDYNGGMRWILDFLATKSNPEGAGNKRTYDGTPVHNSFYNISNCCINPGRDNPDNIRKIWREAMEAGHEVANHTRTHLKGKNGTIMTEDQWFDELNGCMIDFMKPYPNQGIGLTRLYGFRAPRWEINDNMYTVLRNCGIMYDCSGYGGSQEFTSPDGRNYYWPYTMDYGLPGESSIGDHPGLWRMPKHGLIDTDGVKYSSTDYTLIMTNNWGAEQYLRSLKHTLDLRLEGNKSPMIFGAHTELYTDGVQSSLADPQMTVKERRDVIEAFLNYALSFDNVRIVSTKEILDWVRDPVALDDISNNYAPPDNTQTETASHNSITR